MKNSKLWSLTTIVLLLFQIGLELVAIYKIFQMNMLPPRYLAVLVGSLVLAVLLAAFLLLFRTSKDGAAGRNIRRGLGVLLVVLTCVGSLFIASLVSKVKHTIGNVTEAKRDVKAVAAVYVLADDRALKLADSGEYRFGVMGNFDTDVTEYAVQYCREELQRDITVISRPTIVENAEALYNGSIQALIVNESYISLLDELEAYADFAERTRVLTEIPVPEKEPENQTAENAGTADTNAGDPHAAGEGDSADSVDREAAAVIRDAEAVTNTPFVMYISGSDSTSEMLSTGRSDVNILMAVNPQTKQILLVNTPRDYYIGNPAGDGAPDKLTHCGIYGVNCSIEALEDLYGIPVTYYSQINFTGFETLIDAVGGVTVDSEEAFSTGAYNYVQCPNELNGAQALAFARDRKHVTGGDNGRGKNQMRVITALIRKITSDKTILLTQYSAILNSLSGMFMTNMTSEEISELVKMQVNDMASWNISSYAATGTGSSNTTYSMPGTESYVMLPDTDSVEEAKKKLNEVLLIQ